MTPIGGLELDPITWRPKGYPAPTPAAAPPTAKEIAEPEERVTEEVETMDGWKPDFTKANAWEGMPADYAGVATFVPTISNPLPPWEGDVGAQVIPSFNTPDYSVLAQKIIEDARLTTATGTAVERAQARIIIAAGEKATVARAAVIEEEKAAVEERRPYGPEYDVPEEEKEEGGNGWGIAAIAVLIGVLVLGRK